MQSAWSIIAKAAAGFAVVLVLSLGLCGITIALNKTQDLGAIALIGMVIGGAGLLLVGFAAIVVAIMSALRGSAPPPPPPPL